LLDGFADYFDLGEQLTNIGEGLTAGTAILSEKDYDGTVDVLVASRVHYARRQLRDGVARAPQILRIGGLFVAMGPRYCPGEYNYHQVARQVNKDERFDTLVDHEYYRPDKFDEQETNRLIVAQRLK
jgi:hypothetical protein